MVVIQARTVLTLAEKVTVTEWTLLGGVRLPAGPLLLSPGNRSSREEGPRGGRVRRPPALSFLGGLARICVGHTAATKHVCKWQTQPGLSPVPALPVSPTKAGRCGGSVRPLAFCTACQHPLLGATQPLLPVPPHNWNLPGARQAGCQRPLPQASNWKRHSSNEGSGPGTGEARAPSLPGELAGAPTDPTNILLSLGKG